MAFILVVDDDGPLRTTLRCILERAGHEVSEAADGKLGLASYRARRPDLVLIDMIMPNREGTETIVDMRADSGGVPIIAMSGGGFDGGGLYLTIASGVGADEVLKKPIRAKDLLEVVDACLARGADPDLAAV
jgi:DNA-binding response OmpR family regulator